MAGAPAPPLFIIISGLSCRAFPPYDNTIFCPFVTSTFLGERVRQTDKKTHRKDVGRLLIEPALLAADKRSAGKQEESEQRAGKETVHSSPQPLFWQLGQRGIWSSVVTCLFPRQKRPMSLARLHTSTLETPPSTPDRPHEPPQPAIHDPRPPPRTWPVLLRAAHHTPSHCPVDSLGLTLAAPDNRRLPHLLPPARRATCATTRFCAPVS